MRLNQGGYRQWKIKEGNKKWKRSYILIWALNREDYFVNVIDAMHAVIVKLIPNNQVGMNKGLSRLFLDISKKTQAQKTQAPKKLKQIFEKLKQNIQ